MAVVGRSVLRALRLPGCTGAGASTAPRPAGRPGVRAVPVAALIAACVLSLGVGAVAISPVQTLGILLARLGVSVDVAYTSQQEAVLLAIRLPRVLLGALVGAGLASAGAALKAVFRNPLADPALVGVSGGAALGAITAVVFGLASFGGPWTLPSAAFAGSHSRPRT